MRHSVHNIHKWSLRRWKANFSSYFVCVLNITELCILFSTAPFNYINKVSFFTKTGGICLIFELDIGFPFPVLAWKIKKNKLLSLNIKISEFGVGLKKKIIMGNKFSNKFTAPLPTLHNYFFFYLSDKKFVYTKC